MGNFCLNFFLIEKKCSELKKIQIHKIYHLGLLCTNFQYSGIILIFYSKLSDVLVRTGVQYLQVHAVCFEKGNPHCSVVRGAGSF